MKNPKFIKRDSPEYKKLEEWGCQFIDISPYVGEEDLNIAITPALILNFIKTIEQLQAKTMFTL